jgi:hypothetical protein
LVVGILPNFLSFGLHMIMAIPFSCILSSRFYGKMLSASDVKLGSNMFLWVCRCGWKEKNNPNSWWHKTPRYKIVVHYEFLRALKVQCLVFIYVFGYVLFICRFMVFEVCNFMEMNFWVGLLLELGWLLNEECRSCSWKLVGVGDWMEANES